MSDRLSILKDEGDELRVDRIKGTWNVIFREEGRDVVTCQSGTLGRISGHGGGLVTWPLEGIAWTELEREAIDIEGLGACHGLVMQGTIPTNLTSPSHENVQRLKVIFVLKSHILLWKVFLSGMYKNCNIDSLEIFDGSWSCGAHSESSAIPPTFVHVNGWQSWSYAGSLMCGPKATQPDIALPNVLNAGFHNRERGRLGKEARQGFPGKGRYLFESDMFAVVGFSEQHVLGRKQVDRTVVAGFLSQRKQFGIIRVDSCTGGRSKCTMTCDCDGVLLPAREAIESDWACIMAESFRDGSTWANWDSYLSLVGEHCKAVINGGEKLGWGAQNPLTWCSWYHFGPKISSPILCKQVEAAALKNFKLFLIDDGWSPFWGDWDFRKKEDEKELTDKIKGAGMTPGLWMAPFAADFQSSLLKTRPDFILRNKPDNHKAKPCNSAYPGKYFAGLDATHPDVLYHVESSIAARAKNFPYLKLDFLYSCALRDFTGCSHANNRFDPTKTRAQALHMAMIAMRAGAGDSVFLLGCGCPLGSAIGFMDGMRLGADVGHSWAPRFPLPFWDRTNLPCMRNSVRDVLCRSPMNGKWWIGDPDCILLSSPGLSHDEVTSLATVSAVLGGLVTVSDDLTSATTDKRFDIAQRVYPTLSKPFQALDIMTSEIPELFRFELSRDPSVVILACFNWTEDNERSFKLAWNRLFADVPETVHVFEYWTTSCGLVPLSSEECLETCRIPRHASRIFLLIESQVDMQRPLYIGSDIHFGRHELKSWAVDGMHVEFEVNTFRKVGELSRVWIAIPSQANAIFSGENVVSATRTHGKSIYYEVTLKGSGVVHGDVVVDA